MAARVAQFHDEETQSRANDARRVLKWVAVGFSDPIAAENACRAEAPPYYKDLPLVDVSGTKFGGGGWVFTFVYSATFSIAPAAPPFGAPPPPPGPPPPPPPGVPPPPPTPTAPSDSTKLDGSASFTVGGGTVRLLRSFKTVASSIPALALTPAPDFERCIGVTGNGSVEGVEVHAPKFEWSASFEPTSITHQYVKTLGKLVGRTNRSAFYARDPEEVLLVKVSGQWQAGERWKVTYDFWDQYTETLRSPLTAEDVHPDDERLPKGFNFDYVKKGWHYIWFRNQTAITGPTESRFMIEKPVLMYVERVYRTGDFSELEIG